MNCDTPRFAVNTEGRGDLDLRGLCESFVNKLWIPDHLAPHHAAEYARSEIIQGGNRAAASALTQTPDKKKKKKK